MNINNPRSIVIILLSFLQFMKLIYLFLLADEFRVPKGLLLLMKIIYFS